MSQIANVSETYVIDRTPIVIAAEIRSIDAQARKVAMDSAIEIGTRLHEAKALVEHGEWGAWLESNVSYSQSTANNFMRVATEYAGSNQSTFGNLSYSQAVALLAVPADEREAFVEENNVEDMSARELQAAIKDKQELERKLQEEQDQRKLQKENFDTWAAKQAEKAQEEQAKLNKQLEHELKQREALQAELDAAKAETEKAGAKPDPKTKVELRKAEKAVAESQKRISELETDLEAKVKEREAALQAQLAKKEEEIRQVAIEREEAADKRVAEMEAKLRKNDNVAGIKVKLQYEALVGAFSTVVASIADLDSEEQKAAVRGRIAALCDEMKASVQGGK